MSLIQDKGCTLSPWNCGWSEGTGSVPPDVCRGLFRQQALLGDSSVSSTSHHGFPALMPMLSLSLQKEDLTFPSNHSPALLPMVVAALLYGCCTSHSSTAPEILASSVRESCGLGSTLTPALTPQRAPSPTPALYRIIA